MRAKVTSALACLCLGLGSVAGQDDGEAPVIPGPGEEIPVPAPELQEAPAGDLEPGPGPKPEVADEKPPTLGEGFEELVKQLGHDRYGKRIEAQEELVARGMEDLERGIGALYAVYRSADDPEIRLRARQALKRLVIERQPWDGEGYLGIRMEVGRVRGEDGVIRPAVLITEVVAGTGAEAAKLKAGDQILAVDHVVFNNLVPTLMFSEYVRSKKPGDVVILKIRRGQEAMELEARLRKRSPLLNQFQFREDMPDQNATDEADFNEWLKTRIREEKRAQRP